MEEEKAKQFPRRIEAIDKSSTLAVQAPSYRLRIVDEHISPSGTVIRGIGSKQEGEGVASALTATYGASEKLRASFSESTSVPTVDMDITGDRIEGLLIEGSGAKPRRSGHKSAIRKILNKINDIVEKTSHSDSPSIIIEKAYVKVHVPKEAKARARNIQKKPMEFSVPPWGLPAQNTAFVGRKEELSLLLNTFPKLGKAVIGQHITGLGGVGKTQLAIECLWQIYEQQQQLEVSSRYAVMIWLPGERAALELKLRSLAFWLGFGFGEEHPIHQVAGTIYQRLAILSKWQPRVLLAIDDGVWTPELEALLPNSSFKHHFHWLITSRQQEQWASYLNLEAASCLLESFSPEDAWSYFEKNLSASVKSSEEYKKENVLLLAKTLGYLPLALAHVVSYLNCYYPEETILSYRKLFEQQGELLACQAVSAYEKTMLTTWLIVLPSLTAGAAETLLACAYLAGEEISAVVLRAYWGDKDNTNAEIRVKVREHIQTLINLSLVTNVGEQGAIRIHQLLQQVLRWWMEGRLDDLEPENECVVKKLKAINEATREKHLNKDAVLPNTVLGLLVNSEVQSPKIEDIERRRQLISHLENLRMYWEQSKWMQQDDGERVLAKLMMWLARIHADVGEAHREILLLEAAWQIENKYCLPASSNLILIINNLANAYGDMGDAAKQRELLAQLLEEQEKNHLVNELACTVTMINLANAWGELGEQEKKRDLLEKALAIESQYFTENEAWRKAATMDNLANAYCSLGDIEKAHELWKIAVPLKESRFGRGHWHTGITLANSARAIYLKGDVKEAVSRWTEALAINESIYGAHHWMVATILINLAHASKDSSSKESLFKMALEIQRKHYGNTHPKTLQTEKEHFTLERTEEQLITSLMGGNVRAREENFFIGSRSMRIIEEKIMFGGSRLDQLKRLEAAIPSLKKGYRALLEFIKQEELPALSPTQLIATSNNKGETKMPKTPQTDSLSPEEEFSSLKDSIEIPVEIDFDAFAEEVANDSQATLIEETTERKLEEDEPSRLTPIEEMVIAFNQIPLQDTRARAAFYKENIQPIMRSFQQQISVTDCPDLLIASFLSLVYCESKAIYRVVLSQLLKVLSTSPLVVPYMFRALGEVVRASRPGWIEWADFSKVLQKYLHHYLSYVLPQDMSGTSSFEILMGCKDWVSAMHEAGIKGLPKELKNTLYELIKNLRRQAKESCRPDCVHALRELKQALLRISSDELTKYRVSRRLGHGGAAAGHALCLVGHVAGSVPSYGVTAIAGLPHLWGVANEVLEAAHVKDFKRRWYEDLQKWREAIEEYAICAEIAQSGSLPNDALHKQCLDNLEKAKRKLLKIKINKLPGRLMDGLLDTVVGIYADTRDEEVRAHCLEIIGYYFDKGARDDSARTTQALIIRWIARWSFPHNAAHLLDLLKEFIGGLRGDKLWHTSMPKEGIEGMLQALIYAHHQVNVKEITHVIRDRITKLSKRDKKIPHQKLYQVALSCLTEEAMRLTLAEVAQELIKGTSEPSGIPLTLTQRRLIMIGRNNKGVMVGVMTPTEAEGMTAFLRGMGITDLRELQKDSKPPKQPLTSNPPAVNEVNITKEQIEYGGYMLALSAPPPFNDKELDIAREVLSLPAINPVPSRTSSKPRSYSTSIASLVPGDSPLHVGHKKTKDSQKLKQATKKAQRQKEEKHEPAETIPDSVESIKPSRRKS